VAAFEIRYLTMEETAKTRRSDLADQAVAAA